MSNVPWTDAQRAAIRTVDRSVLVSAGAGSGKTAVLAERCAYLVAEAPRLCPIDRLLVVTFTDAAAAQMRDRIAQALRDRLKARPGNSYLQHQLAILDSAQISTIHAFCRRLLNRYFAQADLDPQAPILDPKDAILLRQESAQRAFDALASRKDAVGENFLNFLAAYGHANEAGLRKLTLTVGAFISSLADPEEWCRRAREQFENVTAKTLSEEWLNQLRTTLISELAAQMSAVERLLNEIQPLGDLAAPYAQCLEEYLNSIHDWQAVAQAATNSNAMDALLRDVIAPACFPKIPTLTAKMKEQAGDRAGTLTRAKEDVAAIRDELFKKRLQTLYGKFTLADLAEGIARIGPHVTAFLGVVEAVRHEYQTAKQELGVVDFNDLERLTLDLLQNESNGVAARLRDEFEHVLVDEFQDVNPVQERILRLVSREEYDSRPGNLFAVGDVKQSIYRFRLAEPRLFLERLHRFTPMVQAASIKSSHGVAIDLTENFRSTKPVIDAVNTLFEKLMAADLGGIDYDEHARLQLGLKDTIDLHGPACELHILEKSSRSSADNDETNSSEGSAFEWEQIEREAYVIAQRIAELRASGRSYDDIVILLRAMQHHAGLMVRTLSRLGIPVFAEVGGGFFESIEVLDLLSLLALLDNEQQDIPLAAVLRSPLFGVPLTDSQLVEIRVAARVQGPGIAFHDAVRMYAASGRDAALVTRLRDLLERLDQWRRQIRRRPLADVLWEIYQDTGYLAYVGGLRDGARRRANLIRLHDYARQFGDFKRQGLHRFIAFIDGLRDMDEDLDAGEALSNPVDVVRVMTIHRSKGLEFPVVIVGEMGKRFNLSDARGAILFDRDLGIGMQAVDIERHIAYPTLPHYLVSQAATRECLAEELRTLYVALTRAEEQLILVGTGKLMEAPPNTTAPLDISNRHKPLPLLDRQTAGSMLDWVVDALRALPPALVQYTDQATPPTAALFRIQQYSMTDMGSWTIERPATPRAIERLGQIAAMQSVAYETSQETKNIVDVVARRLTTPYPAAALTRVPAIAAASVLKRRWNAVNDDEEPATLLFNARDSGAEIQSPCGYRFAVPEFLAIAGAPAPTNVGTWTHEFLQYLELSGTCDSVDLLRQRNAFVEQGRFTADEAREINIEAITWFLNSPLGMRLRQKNCRTLREWPFVLGVDPIRYDAAAIQRDRDDVMLVRGIIDCVFDTGEGWEIIDYKTDQVAGADLEARTAEYAGQLQIYASAMEAIWKHRPRRCWLVYLKAQKTIEI